jgi:hypothetical protein
MLSKGFIGGGGGGFLNNKLMRVITKWSHTRETREKNEQHKKFLKMY